MYYHVTGQVGGLSHDFEPATVIHGSTAELG